MRLAGLMKEDPGAPSPRGPARMMLHAVQRNPLPALLALALLVRLATVPLYSFHHPDEIYQYLEQAHRLASGYGVETWEYRTGVRNWLIPILLVWPFWLADALNLPGLAYIPIAKSFLAILSLSVVVSFYRIGRDISATHAAVAGFVGAIWFEHIFFATHALSEPLALAVMAPAAALLHQPDRKRPRHLALAGLLLGLAVLMRYQVAPAAGMLALLTCGLRVRKAWLPLLAGGLFALAIGAAVDLTTGMVPFAWAAANFKVNILEGRASIYGVSGPAYYFGTIAYLWQTTTLLILPLALLGARRYPALLAAAAVHLVAHSLVGHKEYRFILLSTSLLALLASLGFADLLRFVWRDMSARRKLFLLCGALAFWSLTSLMLAAGDRFRYRWTAGGPALIAAQSAGQLPNLCGFALYEIDLFETGGYTYLHRRVPMYIVEKGEGPEALLQSSPAFNAVLAPEHVEEELRPLYRRHRCVRPTGSPEPYARAPASAICVFVRPGPCTRGSDRPDINQWLIRTNQ